jgi:hypothetical protein
MALDQDEFYRNLTDEFKQKVRDNIDAYKWGPKFLDDDHKVWHGEIKHCPTCNDIRITSCCACGCGSCYTCNYRFSCNPTVLSYGETTVGREIGFNNLMPISTPITLGNPKTAFGKAIKEAITPPKESRLNVDGVYVGSKWTHTNGNIYEVFTITNKDTEYPDKYPVTIVYTGENGKIWSRPLSDWRRSMTEMKD